MSCLSTVDLFLVLKSSAKTGYCCCCRRRRCMADKTERRGFALLWRCSTELNWVAKLSRWGSPLLLALRLNCMDRGDSTLSFRFFSVRAPAFRAQASPPPLPLRMCRLCFTTMRAQFLTAAVLVSVLRAGARSTPCYGERKIWYWYYYPHAWIYGRSLILKSKEQKSTK